MDNQFYNLDSDDYILLERAKEVLCKNYHPVKHTVATAILCSSGKVYTGINIESVNGPCAEAVALGAAFTSGEREICKIVSVRKKGDEFPVISPCGNCRQLFVIYAPNAQIIFNDEGVFKKTKATNLLPGAYVFFDKKNNDSKYKNQKNHSNKESIISKNYEKETLKQWGES